MYIYLQELVLGSTAVFSAGLMFGTVEALQISLSTLWRRFFYRIRHRGLPDDDAASASLLL